MKYYLSLIAIVFTTLCSVAQQKFDILSYSVPSGWGQQNVPGQLFLQKKFAEANAARIIVYPSIAAGKDPDSDFKGQWKKYVKEIYPGAADSFSEDIQTDEDWTYYSNYTYATINKSEVVIAFTTLRNKTTMISIVAILPSEASLADLNAFIETVEVDTAVSSSGNTHTKVFRRKRVNMKQKACKFRPGKALRNHMN
jgi:hypothetical protein